MKQKQPMSAPTDANRSDAPEERVAPPEVWAEIEATLDEYIDDWKQAMRERFVDQKDDGDK